MSTIDEFFENSAAKEVRLRVNEVSKYYFYYYFWYRSITNKFNVLRDVHELRKKRKPDVV